MPLPQVNSAVNLFIHPISSSKNKTDDKRAEYMANILLPLWDFSIPFMLSNPGGACQSSRDEILASSSEKICSSVVSKNPNPGFLTVLLCTLLFVRLISLS